MTCAIVSAIVSHSKGKTHMGKMNNRNSISVLFLKNSTDLSKDVVAKPSTEIACSSNQRSCKTTTNLTALVINSASYKSRDFMVFESSIITFFVLFMWRNL